MAALLGARRDGVQISGLISIFFGHQLVTHLAPSECGPAATNDVDGKDVPARHFGVVLSPEEWEALAARLEAARVDFIL